MTDSAAAALTGVSEAPAEVDNGAMESNAAPWTEGFSEDTQAYISNKGWEDPASLLDSYRNLEKFQGGSKNLVEIPGEDADDSVMGNFFDKLGRPGSPEQYGLELPEGGDKDMLDWFTNTAHMHGLSQKQTQAMYNEFNEMSSSKMENFQHEMKVRNEQEIDGLKKEWGGEFESNLNAGRRAVNALGYTEEALTTLEEKLGTGEMMKLFSQIGSKMGEDAFVGGDTSAGFGVSPAQAQAQIDDLKTDSQFMDRYMSGDKAAVDKMKRLMGQAHG